MKTLFHHKILKTFDGTKIPNSKIQTFSKLQKIDYQKLKKCIPFGNGMSYAPSNIGNDVVSIMLDLKKSYKLNISQNTITVSSNVALYEIFNFLIKKNLILEIQPGVSNATIGGCVAANVHGKNQAKDGNFKSIIKSFKIRMTDGKIKNCSRSKNKNLFHLTVGGLGLTGFITEVSLKVTKITSTSVNIKSIQLESFTDLLKYKHFYKTNDIIYSWHFTDHKNFGKGIMFTGNFSKTIKCEDQVLKKIKFIKNPFPISLFSLINTKIINNIFFHKNKKVNKYISISDAFFPFIKNKYYFTLFGSSGFYEHQCIIPYKSFTRYISELKNLNIQYKPQITLLSCKYFNSKHQYLNFSGQGVCLAMNLPKSHKSSKFLLGVESLAVKYKCLININKDSHVSLSVVKKIFKKNYDTFKREIKLFDSDRILTSEMSKKLRI